MTLAAPTFGPAARPIEITDAAGKWLAECFPGFRWIKSRDDLERKLPSQTHRVHLQRLRRSRAGLRTLISPRLVVCDDRLLKWRTANAPVSVVGEAPKPWHATVFNSMFVNFVSVWSVELSGLPQPDHGPRSIDLEAFRSCLEASVLPVLDAMREPSSFAAAVPAEWWWVVGADAVEWALACEDRDAATAMINRRLDGSVHGTLTTEERLELFRDGWRSYERGGQRPRPDIAALGWISAAHGLVAPESLANARQSDMPPTVDDVRRAAQAAFTRGIERARAALVAVRHDLSTLQPMPELVTLAVIDRDVRVLIDMRATGVVDVETATDAELVARLARAVQAFLAEGPAVAWPTCGVHDCGLEAEVREGRAVWLCRHDGHTVAQVGELT